MKWTADIERAVATLALSHSLLGPTEALQVILDGRKSDRGPAAIILDRVPENKLLAAIAAELGLQFVDLYSTDSQWRVDEATVRRCDIAQLVARTALPLLGPGGAVAVAMANPRGDQDMVDYLRNRFEDLTVVLAPASQIQARLVYFDTGGFDAADEASSAPVAVQASDAPPTTAAGRNPIVEWVDNLLARAVADEASDVHFLFNADGTLLVRFRVDGMLRRIPVPLRGRELEIVGTLLSKCPTIDSSDRTRPQDGTFSFVAAGRAVDSRVAMLPQVYGPTVVVRLLDSKNLKRRLDDMGFAGATLGRMRRAVSAPQGAIFVIGPTGSGKTTTLYGLLNEVDAMERNILTVEDPVEYRLPFVGQTQIRSDLGEKSLSFGRALRAILRLDPDVVLVGEVRDSETAHVSMQAAMTGHLVLSTTHAPSALGVYGRLGELDIDPFLASEALSLAVSQRLVRKVHDCGRLDAPNAGEIAFLQRQKLAIPDRVARIAANGCSGCNGSGYRGRLAVVEVLEPTASLRSLIASRAPHGEVAEAATADGYTPILHDAHRLVQQGVTTVAELLRCLDTGLAN